MNPYEEALYHSMDEAAAQLKVTEYIYEDPSTRTVEKVAKSEIISSQRAAEIHRELLGRLPSAA